MIARSLSVLLIGWVLGFVLFAVTLPGSLEGATTDAIVVPTGAAGRIDRGLALMGRAQAKRMLVTGVAPGVRPRDLQREYRASPALLRCCVDLGADAVDTRSNAEETARWLRGHRYRTVRLVTSDWHLRRAAMELRAAVGRDVVVLADGVRTEPRLGTLFNEYNKLILRRIALWVGLGG